MLQLKEKTNAEAFQDSFSEEVWATTYRDYQDKSVQDTNIRVATAIASVEETEEKREEWEPKFYNLLANFKGLPGGRITANAGTEWGGTTFANCFVGGLPDQDIDSIDGIYKVLVQQAQTLKSEGGWGMNFSWIRPRGSFIEGIGVESPGAVRFMEIFDKSSEIITAGSGKKSLNSKAKKKIRKGAMMGVLNCFEKSTLMLTNKGIKDFETICSEKDPDLYAITEDGEKFLICDWIINPPEQLYLVEDELGNTVEVTGSHKFQVYNIDTKEEYLKELNLINSEKELLVRLDLKPEGDLTKQYVKLKSITPTKVENTYDVTVQDKHMLIANGFYTSNCNHPDIVEFITAKQTSNRLSKFNISVNCTEDFMARINRIKFIEDGIASGRVPVIEHNEPGCTTLTAVDYLKILDTWNLEYPDTSHPEYKKQWRGDLKDWKSKGYPVVIHNTVSAKWLWNLITESTYQRNEPGILFLDRANAIAPFSYGEKVLAVNPLKTIAA